MSVEHLYGPVDQLGRFVERITRQLALPLILGLTAPLGLRHALDPDLVAVTSLVATRKCYVRTAMRVGVWWGAGHAGTLLVLGIPMIVRRLPIMISRPQRRICLRPSSGTPTSGLLTGAPIGA